MTTFMQVRHKVRDYDEWKKVFDETEELRLSWGLKGGWILRDIDEDEIIVVLECQDPHRAMEFATSDELKDAVKRSGVKGRPKFSFMEMLAEVKEPHAVIQHTESPEEMGEL